MVGSSSEIMEPSQNIDLLDVDIKEDYPLFMLNLDTEPNKISQDETQVSFSNIVIKTEIEEEPEEVDSKEGLERFIIVEEAVEEVSTTYDEHILEICQEDDNMDTEHYEDVGYESLSSPEYDYRTHYTSHALTDLIS